jgi:inosose dehydratase
MPEALALGTGPVSWGVDFADAPGNPPWEVVLDGIAAAGYRWTELGPLGYLPPDVAAPLGARGLGVTAGFVFEPLHDARQRDGVLATAAAVAERVAALGGRFLVIIDAVSPGRARTAGRSEEAMRLDRDDAASLRSTVAAIAGVARHHGLRPLIHPHAGTHVEFEDEVEPLVDLVELCLDTGHWLYAGHDPVAAYRRWADRIPYLHLKDVDLGRRGGSFWDAVHGGVFRPLGEGCLDLPALVDALGRHGYSGWAIVEQDRLPGGDPVADLVASRRYVEALT